MSVPPKKIRKKRDPGGTREAILQAARKILALGGKEGLSVARVAQRAGSIAAQPTSISRRARS